MSRFAEGGLRGRKGLERLLAHFAREEAILPSLANYPCRHVIDLGVRIDDNHEEIR